MKKRITFGTIENQGDDFLRYSRSLSVEERLRYLQLLRKRAYAKFFNLIPKEKEGLGKKKEIVSFPSIKREKLSDFYSRLNKFKSNGHF
jgi:hypothetical protein